MLILTKSVQAYFEEALSATLDKSTINLSNQTKAYLISLLSHFARSENAYSGTEQGEKQALSLLLNRAQDSEPYEALKLYRHLGDSSLYFSGYFEDSKQTQLVGASFYINIGENAYYKAAGLSKESTISMLYEDLAHNFAALVNILNIMSLYGNEQALEKSDDPNSIFDLISRYRQSKNPKLLHILKKYGICIKSLTG